MDDVEKKKFLTLQGPELRSLEININNTKAYIKWMRLAGEISTGVTLLIA
jgi:hypothetical protein